MSQYVDEEGELRGRDDRLGELEDSVKALESKGKEGNLEGLNVGYLLGSALAIAISWSIHQSILWAILHGILSWFYVIYFAWTRG
jgi:hypothetical protein